MTEGDELRPLTRWRIELPGIPRTYNSELRIDTFAAAIISAFENAAAEQGLVLERIEADVTPVTRWRVKSPGKLGRFNMELLLDTADPAIVERFEKGAVDYGFLLERIEPDG